MSATDELANLLPTRSTRLIVGLTGFLAPAMFLAPHFLSPLMPNTTEAEVVLMQLLAATSTTLAGAIIVLSLMVREPHLKAREFSTALSAERDKTNISKTPGLKVSDDGHIEQEKERILTFLSRYHDWVSDRFIADAVQIDLARATYHFVELDRVKMIVTCPRGACFSYPGRQIEQRGREYLMTHGLL